MRASLRSMNASPARRYAALVEIAARLGRAGANLTICAPGMAPLHVGTRPDASRVAFRELAAIDPLLRGDHLALAEAYLAERIDVDGDWSEVIKVSELIELEASPFDRLRLALAIALRGRRRTNRDAIAFHYDRPADFFLPWFERWRSYSHGFYHTPDDDPSEAQARKLQYAIDALGLRPGMRVLDVGGGWGSFVEYAGSIGIHVHALTISREQCRFVEELIRARSLPCSVELVDFLDYQPREPFDGAVFLGTLEHVGHYRQVAQFLREHLRSGAAVYADFCARQAQSNQASRFMRKWIWPGTTSYVDVAALVRELGDADFNVHELVDDTLSYAWTVRNWALRLEAHHEAIAERFGEVSVRAFLLFLWGSHHFLANNRTQAYHLVAAREPRAATNASGTLMAHRHANASPSRA